LRLLFNRGFSPDTLTKWGIGYDGHSRRLSIPFRNVEGNLVGFKGRSTKRYDKPKYVGIGDKSDKKYYGFSTVKTSNYIFGLNSASGDAIIVEGEFDAISLRERGFPGAVAIGGSNISDKQLLSLKRQFPRITTLFDPDDAGRKAERFLSKNLISSIPVSIARLENNDPADSSTQEIEYAIEQAKSAIEITN
jgi:DNA primase